jgi:hypothetical protein
VNGQKKPQHQAGVASLFAVTHQGPAQGGKAGDSKLSGREYNNTFKYLQQKSNWRGDSITASDNVATLHKLL